MDGPRGSFAMLWMARKSPRSHTADMLLSAAQAREALAEAVRSIGETWADSGASYIPDEVSRRARTAVDSLFLQVDLADREWHSADPRTGALQIHDAEQIREDLVSYCIQAARDVRSAVLVERRRINRDTPAAEARRRRLEELRPRYEEMRRQKEEEFLAAQEELQRGRWERLKQEQTQLGRLDALRFEEEQRQQARKELEQRQFEAQLAALQEEQQQLELQEQQRAIAERARWAAARPAPPPPPQLYGVSDQGAELLVRDWMRHLGVLDATVTPLRGDGGTDVESNDFIAQVKNYTGLVPVSEVRDLGGVAAATGKQALLFTSGTLSGSGLDFADKVRIAVIQYSAVDGTLVGLNDLGTRCTEAGIPEAFAALMS